MVSDFQDRIISRQIIGQENPQRVQEIYAINAKALATSVNITLAATQTLSAKAAIILAVTEVIAPIRGKTQYAVNYVKVTRA